MSSIHFPFHRTGVYDIDSISRECLRAMSAALLLDTIDEDDLVTQKGKPNPAAFPMDGDKTFRSQSNQLEAQYIAFLAIYTPSSTIGTLLGHKLIN